MRYGLFSILKFFLAIVLLPLVIAVSIAFYQQLMKMDQLSPFFIWGVFSYVIMHLFLFVPQYTYEFGQKVFASFFPFSVVLAKLVPLIAPLWMTLLLVLYYIVSTIFKMKGIGQFFVFMGGFTLSLHIILTAQDLHDEDSNALKANYLFSISLIFILNLFLVSLLMSLDFKQFSFVSFFDAMSTIAKEIYASFWHKMPWV